MKLKRFDDERATKCFALRFVKTTTDIVNFHFWRDKPRSRSRSTGQIVPFAVGVLQLLKIPNDCLGRRAVLVYNWGQWTGRKNEALKWSQKCLTWRNLDVRFCLPIGRFGCRLWFSVPFRLFEVFSWSTPPKILLHVSHEY